MLVAEPVEQVDEVLRREVAGGAGRVRAAAGPAGRGVETADPCREARDDVGKGRPARVVEVERDALSGIPASIARPVSSPTWLGTPTPIVSPKQISSAPSSSSRSATSMARRGSTAPCTGSRTPSRHTLVATSPAHAARARTGAKASSDAAIVIPMLRVVNASDAAVNTAIASAPAASARARPRAIGTRTG